MLCIIFGTNCSFPVNNKLVYYYYLLWIHFNTEITYYVNWDFTFHFKINRELLCAIFELIVYTRHVSMCAFHLLWMQVSG